nr:hypothetical protein [uncultured Flavobacterium sp.]
MKTETLKISITQRILSINDNKILSKIVKLLDEENIVGYDADGNPISEKEYTKDILEALHELNEKKLETYSSEDVRKKILG